MKSGNFIRQLKGDFQYSAFVPNPLPFDLKIDNTLQFLLSKADIALGRLDGISELLPDIDFFLFMYVRKEATLSSQIEGTKATFSDVLKAEAKIEDSEIHNDVDEILNYIEAMNYSLKRLETLPLSLRLIKEIHRILLQGVRGEGKNPGEFKSSQNWVGGPTIQTASFIPPSPHETLILLDNLEKFFYDKPSIPILIKAGLIHSQFECIHPFLDGNGRMGRLLVTLYLYQQSILKKPLLYLSEFFKKYRQDYYDRLNAIHSKDEIEEWLKFFCEGVAVTAEQSVITARKIIKLREKDIQSISSLGRKAKTALSFLNSLYRTPMIRIKDVEIISKLRNPNAISLVNKFTDLGILEEISGRKRNKIYVYKKYIDLFQ